MNFTDLEIIAAAGSVALAATPCCIYISKRFRLFDLLHPRKVLKVPVPRICRFAIPAAVLMVVTVLVVVLEIIQWAGQQSAAPVFTVFATAALLLIVGCCDYLGKFSIADCFSKNSFKKQSSRLFDQEWTALGAFLKSSDWSVSNGREGIIGPDAAAPADALTAGCISLSTAQFCEQLLSAFGFFELVSFAPRENW